jgi:hypothetical protein
MAAADVRITIKAELKVDERTAAALLALGWTPPDSEPVAGRDFDPNPGGHWEHCLCKWCHPKAERQSLTDQYTDPRLIGPADA